MSSLQHLRLHLGLPPEPTDEELATEEARYARLRDATPGEQSALRMKRLRAAGWDARAHGFDPRRLAGGEGELVGAGASAGVGTGADPGPDSLFEDTIPRLERRRRAGRPA